MGRGPDHPEARYMVQAYDITHEQPWAGARRRPGAGGNSAATLAEAIAVVHWGDLDRDE